MSARPGQAFEPKYDFVQRGRAREVLGPIHFLNVRLLRTYLSPVQKIVHSKFTGLSRRDQRRAARAIKLARQMALLPFKH